MESKNYCNRFAVVFSSTLPTEIFPGQNENVYLSRLHTIGIHASVSLQQLRWMVQQS
jgi:hypothetical protein